MKKVEIYEGNFTIEQINSNPDKIFIMVDNTMRVGLNNFRDITNVISIKIKKGSSAKPAAFFSNSDFDLFKKTLLDDLVKIKIHLLQDKVVVFTNMGYGNIEKIDVFGPKIKEYLDISLKSNFNFDNKTGKKFSKIPSYDDIHASIPLQLDTLVYNTLNPSQIIQATLIQKKIAFTIDNHVEMNTLIKLISTQTKDVVVCRVTNCHSCADVSPNQWSLLELCDIKKYDPKKFQVLTEFICSVNPTGLMSFNNDIFGSQKKIQNETKNTNNQSVDVKDQLVDIKDSVLPPTENVKYEKHHIPSNTEIVELLNSINSKLEILLDSKKSTKNIFSKIKMFFKKSSLIDILTNEGLLGDIKDLGEDNYEVISNGNTYFIKFKKGLIKNSIEIIPFIS